MPKYRIDLDDFTEEVFGELEKINESGHGHELVTTGVSAEDAAIVTCERLIPFFMKNFAEVEKGIQ